MLVSVFVTIFAVISPLVGAIPSSFLEKKANITTSTLVNLRVEGLYRTIFEGPILTRGHVVSTPSGGSHECNGLNLNANPKPDGTCTTALDDAAHLHHFSFDGYAPKCLRIRSRPLMIHKLCVSTFDDEFDDFFITSIGGDTETDTQFWGLLLDFQFTPVGGCQQEVKFGNEVLWAFDAFNANAFLKLTGPVTTRVNKDVVLTVTDGSSGSPIEGAAVDGKVTDVNGHVTLTFTTPGVKTLKAEKESAIRSNGLVVLVV